MKRQRVNAARRGAKAARSDGPETDAPSREARHVSPGASTRPRSGMFRPAGLARSRSRRLLATAVAVGIQYERHRLLAAGAPAAGSSSFIRGLSWPELVAAFAVLLLAAIGLVLFGTYRNYRAVTQTFERVKNLMRNILESIPTGVLTLDAGGAVTSLNGPGERLLGLRGAAIRGRSVGEALQAVPDLAAWSSTPPPRPPAPGTRFTLTVEEVVGRPFAPRPRICAPRRARRMAWSCCSATSRK